MVKWLIESKLLSVGVGRIGVDTALNHPAVSQWFTFIIIFHYYILVQGGVNRGQLEDVLLRLELPHLLVLVVVVQVVLLLSGRLLVDEFVEGEV